MPTATTVQASVYADQWLQLLTTSAMRLELAIRLTLSLLHILMSSVCQAQRTAAMRHVLDLHNFFRRQAAQQLHVANMNKLSWDERLAARAEEAARCSSWRERRRSVLGSNVNVGRMRADRSHTLARLIGSWFAQQDYFNRTDQYQGCSPWNRCLQYRAVPNEDTFDFTYGSSCSKCEDHLPFCEDGLCSSCDHEDRSMCVCRKTCNREGVGEGRLNATSCTCDCAYGLGPNCDEPCRNPPNIEMDVCGVLYSLQTNPLYQDRVNPIDCERFGRQCPEQCLCTPYPGTESVNRNDDYYTGDNVYYADFGAHDSYLLEDYSGEEDENPVVFLK